MGSMITQSTNDTKIMLFQFEWGPFPLKKIFRW